MRGTTGEGAVIGVVDRGCDFTHRSLRTRDGGTRLLALWDQRADVVYTARQIRRALEARAPFAALGYDPFDEDDDDDGAAIEIAAGTAPGAALVFVHLAAPSRPCVRDAVDLIARVAGDRPCVVNLPIGKRALADDRDGRVIVRSPRAAARVAQLFGASGRALPAAEIRRALAAEVTRTREAAAVFDAFTVTQRRSLQLALPDVELIAPAGAPPLAAVRPGDWLVERALGEGDVAAMREITHEMIPIAEAARRNRIVVRRTKGPSAKRFSPRGTGRFAPRGPVAKVTIKAAGPRKQKRLPPARKRQPRPGEVLGEVIGGFVDEPPTGTIEAGRNGMFLRMPFEVEFSPGLDKLEQIVAMLLRTLVGNAYTPELASAMRDELEMTGSGEAAGIATKGERVAGTTGGVQVTSVAGGIQLVSWLRAKQLEVLLDDGKLRRLEHAAAVEAAWLAVANQTIDADYSTRRYVSLVFPAVRRYAFATRRLFTDIAWSSGPLVERMRVAEAEFAAKPESKSGSPEYDNRNAAIMALWDVLNKGIAPLDAIWGDGALTDHDGYKKHLFPRDKAVDWHPARLRFVEICLVRYPDLAKAATESGNSKQRKQLLDKFTADFQIILDLQTGASASGEDALQQEIAKANADPFPCSLTISPSGPLFPSGGDLDAEINIRADHWISLFNYHYWWDLLRVEPDSVTETSTSRLTMLGRRLGRDAKYTWADFKHVKKELEGTLGMPGTGAISVGASLAIIRFVGTILKDVLRAIFERPYEKSLVLPGPGIYMLRCMAGNPDSRGPLERVPSAAYQLLFVVPPEELSKLVAEDELEKLRKLARTMPELVADINSGLLTPDELTQKQSELELGKAELAGDAASLYAVQRKNLERAKTDVELQRQISRDPAHVQKAIEDRLAEIEKITTERARRIKLVTGTPYRVRATLVTDSGTMHLLIEAIDVKTTDAGIEVLVIDSTAKHSGFEQLTRKTRMAAIKDGLLSLLQNSTTGYGRGVCTLLVPVSGATGIGRHERETFVVGKDLVSLYMEVIEGGALIVSVLALLAAPFTGGASLMIMIPMGIIGAIPSGYRLAKRSSEGTFDWDMDTALDIVNIASTFFSLGQMGSGALKLGRLATVFQFAGHGSDGLGIIMGTGQFFDELQAIANDPNLLPGQRKLKMAMAVATKLLNDGSMIGHALAMRTYGNMLHENMDPAKYALPAGVIPDDVTLPKASDRSIPATLKPAPEPLRLKVKELIGGNREIAVLHDPDLPGASAEVRYVLDAYGFISDVYIALGKRAGPDQLPSHAATAKQLLKFTGVLGKARTLLDWARAFFARDPSLKVGKTEAWQARLELEKLPKQISDYMRSIGKDGPADAGHVDAYIRGLLDQMAEHEAALNDASKGSGRIAAHDRTEPPKRDARKAAMQDGREFAIGITELDPGAVTVKDAPSEQAHISVKRDATGQQVEIRVPKRAPDGTPITAEDIATAAAAHQELANRRPADPTKPDAARPWTAADEARYRGYPDAEPGHTWTWSGGDLVHDGTPARRYSEPKGTFEPGTETKPTPTGPLKPEDAARWPDVKDHIGKPIKDGVPKGYKKYEVDGQPRIRREVADDAEWPRLNVDDNQMIQPGKGSNRLSDPAAAARNYGPKPDNHQLHHAVPDQVVRTHPLFEQARTRGKPPYDLDRKSNLIALPENETARAKEPPSQDLPLHRGSHPDYSAQVTELAERTKVRLVDKYGSLANVPADVLAKAAQQVETMAQGLVGAWKTTQGDKLQ